MLGWIQAAMQQNTNDHANHYSIGHLFEILQIYLSYKHCDETKS